jgi:hypothetical protein
VLRPAENRCCDSPFSGATLRQSPVSRAKHLLRLVAEAAFRSARSWSVAGHGAGYLRELLGLLRGVRRFKPNLFRLASALALSAQSSTVYRMSSSRPSTTVTGSTADCRWKSPLPRAKAVGLKISSKDIPLNLLCLTFGPLLYGASLGTVAAILIFPFVSIIVSHHDGLPIVARSIRAFARVVPLLALMLASTAWSLDLPTISHRLALAGDLAFCR